MHRSGANAECFSRFEDTRAGRQLLTECARRFASLAGRPSEAFPLAPRPLKTRFDTLDNHRALEFAEHAEHLKHDLTGWCAGVDPLLMEVEIDPLGVQFAEERDQLLQ